jgi:hypothetical protein
MNARSLTPVDLDAATVRDLMRLPGLPDVVAVAAWKSDELRITVRRSATGWAHIAVKRQDGGLVRDWRQLQRVKNHLGGEESTAIEVFPPESRLVDTVNEYHLWVLPDDFELPVGFSRRSVLGPDEAVEYRQPGESQRAF